MSRSPRCGERNASPPRATQNVLFSSAPAATIGRGAATGSGERAGHVAARAAEREAAARTTESSQRRWIGRSWARNASAIPAEPLPRLVVLERRSARRSGCRSSSRAAAPNVGEQQVVERRVRQHQPEPRRCPGATDGATGASRAAADEHDRPLARARAARASSSSTLAPAPRARSVISANGLSSRCLRARSRATASSFGGVAGEVVAAEALDGDDRAVAQRPRGRLARAAARAAARRPGRRSARRGSGGRPGPRTRAGSRRRAGSRPSSCSAGRRARRARS